MALCAKNSYQIELPYEISNQRIFDLLTCYEPCIGMEAVNFYLLLVSESRIHTSFCEHTRLCKLSGMDIKVLDAARIRCEQFSLIRTYISKDETQYVYEVLPPLSAREFLKHDVYGRLYLSRVGAKEAEVTSSSLVKSVHLHDKLVDISASFDASLLKNWDNEKEVEFSNVQSEKALNLKRQKGFDMELFLSLSTALTFPYQARTQENLDLISDLGALYGISEERMRILVGHCINNATERLNQDMLKRMASYEKVTMAHEPKNKYDMPPVLFLENIQQGISVTQVDKRLLEWLMSEMHFSPEVINVLVEYVLSINENRLTRSFVESIASSWLRNKVSTVEDALKMCDVKPVKRTARTSRKAVMPKYEKTNDQRELNEEEKQRLMQALSQLEE